MSRPRRIAILGAESTGKSTLAEALAVRHDALWVPEYLREFVASHGRTPREEEQVGIALTQIAREDAVVAEAGRRPSGLLFCDTTPLMTMLYSEHYWGRVDTRIAQLAMDHDYALTVVTAPDTPWEPDGLQRESEQVRQQIHAGLVEALDALALPYLLVRGDLQQRIAQVDMLLER